MVKKTVDDYIKEREARENATDRIRLGYVKLGMTAFVILVAFGLMILSVRVVETGTVGVLLQFGEMKGVLQPGLHIVAPVISGVVPMSVQTMKYEVGASAASKDLQIVTSTIAVNYHIMDDSDSVQYLYRQFRGNHEDRMIAPMVQEVVKANTAKFTASDLIQQREQVKLAIAESLKTKLLNYGIVVDEVSITNFDFSEEFNNAIEAKVVVEQQRQQMELELMKKEIEVKKLVVSQNATATALVIQADADKQAAILRAEGEANATLIKAEATKQAIEKIQAVLTDEYIAYQYSQRWDGELPYFMAGSSPGMLVNVPTVG